MFRGMFDSAAAMQRAARDAIEQERTSQENMREALRMYMGDGALNLVLIDGEYRLPEAIGHG